MIGITLRLIKKNFQEEELPHQLFLTRQKSKGRNNFTNNMSMHIKLSKVQISKLFQSGGSLGSCFGKAVGKLVGNLDKKAILSYGVPLAKDACLD